MVGFENFQEIGIPARISRKVMVILSVQFHSQEQSFRPFSVRPFSVGQAVESEL
jgi:hypothetical protein